MNQEHTLKKRKYNDSLFIQFCIESRCFETFMKEFVTPLDEFILKLTCKDLNKLLPIRKISRHELDPILCYPFDFKGLKAFPYLAMENCYFKLAYWLYENNNEHYQFIFYQNFIGNIAKTEEEKKYQKLLCLKYNSHIFVCEHAAFHKNFPLLKWAFVNGFSLMSDVCSNAAMNGDLEMLKWARDNGCKCDNQAIYQAAKLGHLDILKYLAENNCDWNDWRISSVAAERGQLEVLKWFKENNCPVEWEPLVVSNAAFGGYLEIVKWLRENQCPWTAQTCSYAASNGHLEIIKWALENNCPIDKYCLEYAKEYNHLHIVKWLKENNIKFL